jgi:peptide/nickel transport system substrate-binding protein
MNGRSKIYRALKSKLTEFSLEEKLMSRKSIIILTLSFLALAAIALAACAPTEVVKTVIVTQEVQVAGTPVIQEVVVTATPEAVQPTAAAPRTLVICMGQEPDTLFFPAGSMLADTQVQEAFLQDVITTNTFAYQPVLLTKLPSIADGDAVVNQVAVKEGDTIIDDDGNPATLTAKTASAAGTMVRPAGCRSSDCAVEYDGTNVTQMDQMEVTFAWVPGVLWSDGTPMTASDSVYGFTLNGSPDIPAPTRYVYDRTASYTAPDDNTTVWTGLPGFFDQTYQIEVWSPLPEHALSQYSPADLVTQYDAQGLWKVGTGPYILDEWTHGEQITGHKNPNYYKASEGLPHFDNIVYRFTGGDANAAIAAILAGECDIVDQTTALDGQSQLLLQLQAKGQINATFVTGTTWEHADFNIQPVESIIGSGAFSGFVASGSTDGPFGDVRLRQAIIQCIDRQSLVDTVLYGQSIVIDSYLPPNHPLYASDAKHWPYDTAAANALLDEIGWKDTDNDPATPRIAQGVTGVPDNTPLSFAYESTNAALRQQVTQLVAQNLAGCGIKANISLYPASQWFAAGPDGKLYGRLYDLGEFAWLTGVTPPCDLYLSTQLPTAANGWGGQNSAGFHDADYDKACNTQLQSLPGEAAYETAAKDAQRIFAEQVAVVPYFLRLKLAATRPDMCNFIMDPTNNTEMWNLANFDYGNGPGCTK